MDSKKMSLALLLALVFTANAFAEEARIISVQGRVTIDGKPAKVGDLVPAGAKVETQSGSSATLAVGEENVMKISSDSALLLQHSADGGKQLNLVLENGRVEGVRKVAEITGSTKVATESGTMEVSGGRYLIDKSPGKDTVFLTVDGGAQLQSNSSAVVGPTGFIPLQKGDYVSLTTASRTENKQVMAVSERVAMSPEQANAARIPIPEMPRRELASAPGEKPAPVPTFRDTLPPAVSPVNQDPTQPIVPRDPRVKVIFRQ